MMPHSFGPRLVGIILAAAFGVAVAAPAAQAQKPVSVTVASFQIGSSWYVYAVTLGEILREVLPAGSTIDTPPGPGGVANARLVSEGRTAIGFSHAVVNRWAREGTVAYDTPMPNLRALVGGLDRYYIAVAAAGRSSGPGLEKYLTRDKPDTRIALFPKGSLGTYGGELVLALAGAAPDQLERRGGRYTYAPGNVVRDRIAGGSADLMAAVVTVGHPLLTEIAQARDVVILQPSEATLAGMRDRYGFGVGVLPKGSFRGQDADVRLPSTTTAVIARDDLPEQVAYAVTRAIVENKPRLVSGHKALEDFVPEDAWKPESLGLPLHPGAARYYRERGWLR